MIGRRNFLQLAGRAAGGASVGLLAACSGRSPRDPPEKPPRGSGRSESRWTGGDCWLGRLTPVASDSTHRSSASGTQLRAGWSPLRPTGVRRRGKEGAAGPDAARRRWRCPKRISNVLDLADEAGLILLAPESRGRS